MIYNMNNWISHNVNDGRSLIHHLIKKWYNDYKWCIKPNQFVYYKMINRVNNRKRHGMRGAPVVQSLLWCVSNFETHNYK